MKRRESTIKVPVHEASYHSHSLNFLLWVIPAGFLALLGALFYRPSLNYPFQFDDLANITKFFGIRNLSLQEAFFVHARWISTWLNAVNYRMGNFEPYYYRLFNVSFHVLTSVIVFYFFYLALRNVKQNSFFKQYSFSISFFTALLFLLHPAQTQTVSYIIQGRLEGLAGLLVIAVALCFMLVATLKNSVAKIVFTALFFITAAFSCGTKEIAIVSPALIFLVDWFFVAQGNWSSLRQRWWLHTSLFLVVGCLYLYYLKPAFFVNLFGMKMEYINNIGNTITENRLDKITPLHYFISEFKVILHYLGIFLWPFNMSVDYDWMMVKNFFSPDCIFPFLILVAIFGQLGLMLRKDRTNLIVFGMLWFFVAIAPRATIMPSTELIADYKTYLASAGWLFVLASGLVYLVVLIMQKLPAIASFRSHPALHMATLTVLALPIGFAAYERNKVWRSAEEFWGNILQNAPNRARVHNNYGVALSEQGRYRESIPYFIRATKMDALYPDPWNNLAVAYSVTNKLDNAIEALKQSLRINPYYPEAYNNLASFLIQKKDLDTAEKMLQVATQLRPHYGKAHYNWGRIHFERAEKTTDQQQKDALIEKGWECYKTACTKADFDNNLMGLNEYAKMSMQLQRYDDAIFAIKKMLALNPRLDEAYFTLGNIYYFKKEYEHALPYYEEAKRRMPNDVRGWNNAGECYFITRQYATALTYFHQASRLSPQLVNTRLRIAECQTRLGKYQEAKMTLNDALKMDVSSPIRSNIAVALAQLDSEIRRKAA